MYHLKHKSYPFDKKGMVFKEYKEYRSIICVKAIDIIKENKDLMGEEEIDICLCAGKSYEWAYFKNTEVEYCGGKKND